MNAEIEASTNISDLAMLLACQRSIDSLNTTLHQTLSEIFAEIPFQLYIDGSSGRSHSFYPFDASTTDTSIISSLNAMDSNDVLTEFAGFYIYPAIQDEKIFCVVVTELELPEEPLILLLNLLSVYCNMQMLLSDSAIDGLTQLYNRKSFDISLEHELESSLSRRKSDDQDRQSYLVIIDIDHFKMVNDTHGHLIGDEVLIELANRIKGSFRQDDGLFRYGGEEFALLVKDITEVDLTLVLHRFQEKVNNKPFPTAGHLTVSIGYCQLTSAHSPAEAITHSDQALYYAKENGRDQIASYQALVEANLIEVKSFDTDFELF